MRALLYPAIFLYATAAAAQTATCIPPEQWAPREKEFVAQMKQVYTQQGLPFNDQIACEAVGSFRQKITALMGNVGALSVLSNPATAQALQNAAPMAAVPASPAAAMPATGVAAATSEASLGQQFAQWPALTSGVEFQIQRDGFDINGQRYVDPQGQTVGVGYSNATGDFTEIVNTAPNQYVIKSGRANSGSDPIVIATATRNGMLWNVTTVTGKSYGGFRLIPISRGFIVARLDAAFRYIPGVGTTNIVPPQGFTLAAFQNGDIGATGYVLMERITENSSNNPLGSLVHSVQTFGALLGMAKVNDYMLVNIDNGKTVPINISTDGKQIQIMRECVRRNALVSICAKMDSFDSLYDQLGRNNQHYFWRVQWFKSDGIPIMVSMQGGVSTITVTNLDSGQNAELFHRALGINGYDVRQRADGKVVVTANMAFTKQTIDDAAAQLNNPAAVASAQADTASTPAAPTAQP